MALDPILDAVTRADTRPGMRNASRLGDLERRVSAIERGSGADSSWYDPDFEPGWADWPDGLHPVGYVKFTDGLVLLRGFVQKSSAPVALETILTLPAGARPAFNVSVASVAIDVFAPVLIRADGTVCLRALPAGFTNGSWLSLDGLTFRAEQ